MHPHFKIYVLTLTQYLAKLSVLVNRRNYLLRTLRQTNSFKREHGAVSARAASAEHDKRSRGRARSASNVVGASALREQRSNVKRAASREARVRRHPPRARTSVLIYCNLVVHVPLKFVYNSQAIFRQRENIRPSSHSWS